MIDRRLLPTPATLALAGLLALVALGTLGPWATATVSGSGWFSQGDGRVETWRGHDGNVGRAIAAVATAGALLVGAFPMLPRQRAWLALGFATACGASAAITMPNPQAELFDWNEYTDARPLGGGLVVLAAAGAAAVGAFALLARRAWCEVADADERELGRRALATSLAVVALVGALGPWSVTTTRDADFVPHHEAVDAWDSPVGMGMVALLGLGAYAPWLPWPRAARWLAATIALGGAAALLSFGPDARPSDAAGVVERVRWGYYVLAATLPLALLVATAGAAERALALVRRARARAAGAPLR